MVLKDIMAISGQPGLFRFVAQGKNAIIVEHLETKRRGSAFNTARVSSLDEITIFTEKEDISLGKVFDIIHDKENGGQAIDYKSDPEKLKAYMAEVLPDYDRDRVYNSDIRKILQWYNILHGLNMLVREEPAAEEKAEKETPEKQGKEEKTAPETTKKKESSAGRKKSSGEKTEPPEKKKSAKPKTK